jgi:hypothetical protein
VGSYDTAKQALEAYQNHQTIRPTIDPKKEGRYIIRDRDKKITLQDLKLAADKE